MEFISMSKIGQFRNTVKDIREAAQFVSMDENGDPIYRDIALPTLTFIGTTKLHGTNASIAYDGNEIWAQSKNRIITPEEDNAGFARFVDENKEYFRNLLSSLYIGFPVAVFGEWAGDGINSPAAIAKVKRSFFIFGVKAKDVGWLDLDIALEEHPNVYKITDFKQYSIDIDFNVPEFSQNKLVQMAEEVENECPVAKEFGISGIGEGLVFHAFFGNKLHRFKVKGEKHAKKCKIKKLQKVDDEKLQLIQDVAEKVTPIWRLDQMWNETFNIINGGAPCVTKTGDFLKKVFEDIIEEDSDIVENAGLTLKDINKKVAFIAKVYFTDRLNTL